MNDISSWPSNEVLAALLASMPAFLSVIAAFLAAYATWRGPVFAAAAAERLRRDGDRQLEKRRHKLQVFAVLMEERAAWYSAEAVRAFNLIDVVFYEARAVRDAWAEFYAGLDPQKAVPEHEKDKRFRLLLVEMAKDLGLGDGLRLDDFNRVYLPTALQEEQLIKSLSRQESLRRLRGETSPTANLVSAHATTIFPPPPKSATAAK